MNRYDSEYESVSDSDVGEAAEGAERLVERHHLAIKAAVFYAVAFGVGLLAYRLVESPSAESLVAIALWFTVIFAVLTGVLGAIIKAAEAIRRRREEYR